MRTGATRNIFGGRDSSYGTDGVCVTTGARVTEMMAVAVAAEEMVCRQNEIVDDRGKVVGILVEIDEVRQMRRRLRKLFGG